MWQKARTPPVTTDLDVGPGSISVVTNDPILPGKGNGGSKGTDKGAGGSKVNSQTRDTTPRAVVVGGGLGLGGYQIKTAPIASCTQSRGCTNGSQSGPKTQPPKPAAQQPAAKVCSQTKHGRQCN